MKLRSVIATIAALSILALPTAQAEAASRYITVNAEGTVKVVPNAVKIMGQVTVVEGTNAAALAKANSASSAVRKAVISNGVSTKDLATTSLTVYPEYNYTQDKGSVQVGYRATQSFTVVVKNAKAKAASYAKLMGVKLGKVNYIVEGSASYNPPIYGVAKAAADSATVIDLGTQDVSVSISVQWALN